jgi:anaerobic selenocysteine-containing dehydrogenase
MKITRRGFIKSVSGAALGTVASGMAGESRASLPVPDDPLRDAVSTTSVCPYCAVGCGLVVKTLDGKVARIEGDPEHPINQGALCSKGAALLQTANSPGRLKKVLYRGPGQGHWEEKSWEWALPRIAERIRQTRDATLVREKDGDTVNRTEGIACLGGASLDNEECYLYAKLARSLGVVYLEHQARI